MPDPVKRKIPVTIGADPELFLREKATGRFVSAHDKMPGTKSKPSPCEQGAMQVDGVAAEFNILPASDSKVFSNNCLVVMNQIRQTVGDTLELVIQPSVSFDPDHWNTIPMNAKELGCDPDFNAWTGDRNPSPKSSDPYLRVAGGHVHIGWTKGQDPNDPDHFEDCRVLVKELDYYLGAPSVIWDADRTRREMYGRAGAFRAKPYGVEYRVLSNQWLREVNLTRWVYTAAHQCVTNLLNGSPSLEKKYGNLAQEILDGSVRWWDSPKKGQDDNASKMYNLWYNEIGVTLPIDYLDKAYLIKEEKETSPTSKPRSKKISSFQYTMNPGDFTPGWASTTTSGF